MRIGYKSSLLCVSLLLPPAVAAADEDPLTLERAGRIEAAEGAYRRRLETSPKDARACADLAGFYGRPFWGGRPRFDDMVQTLERCAEITPTEAEGYYRLAQVFWDKAYKDTSLSDKQKETLVARGLENADKALKLNPEYFEALVFKGLLLRLKAMSVRDPAQQKKLLAEADQLRDRSQAMHAKVKAAARPDPARDAALALEAAVNAGDASAIAKAIDVEAILDAGMPEAGPADLRTAFRRNMTALVGVQPLAGVAQAGGSYRLLRVSRDDEGRPFALFRLLPGNGSVNYHEYLLREDATGVKAVDFYVFTNGEWMSESVHRNWLLELGEAGFARQLQSAAGFESDLARSRSLIDTLHKLEAEGRGREGLDTWRRLPASLQVNKSLLLQRIRLATGAGEREYAEAVEAFVKHFPNDAALDMYTVGLHFDRKEHDLALGCIARLQASVNDPYLDFLRGNVLQAKNDRDGARSAWQSAIFAEKTLLPPYWMLLAVSLADKDHWETLRLLRLVERDAGFKIPDLTEQKDYADFVRSEAYKAWKDPAAGIDSAGIDASGAFGGLPPAPPPPAEPVRVGGQIPAPKKLKNVPPVYPDIAKMARVQGIVIVECLISAQGKVEEVTVLRSIPLLDMAAIEAVKQWVFTPTLLNGVPVPVIMTATVNFSLQ